MADGAFVQKYIFQLKSGDVYVEFIQHSKVSFQKSFEPITKAQSKKFMLTGETGLPPVFKEEGESNV